MLALRERARQKGIKFSLLDATYREDFSPAFRIELQKEAMERYLDWMEVHGRHPVSTDFGYGEGKVGLLSAQLFGESNNKRFFNDSESALLAMRVRAKERGMKFSLLDRHLPRTVSPAYRLELRAEAVDRYLDWAEQHGRLPKDDDFAMSPGSAQVNPDQLFGRGQFRLNGGRSPQARFFDSRAEAEAAIALRAKERGIEIPSK